MNNPAPPYYAVIFTSARTNGDNGYDETADRMLLLARTMPGFLGVDSAREDVGITVSYWDSLDAIRAWRDHPEHAAARSLGRAKWYESFSLKVCRVERETVFPSWT